MKAVILNLDTVNLSIETLQEKIQEYLNSGLQLGWLINPQQQQVEIYRQNQPVEIKNLPTDLNGEDILPGFSLTLSCFE